MAFPSIVDGYTASNVTCKNGVKAEWNNREWSLVFKENPNNSERIECSIEFVSGIILAQVAEIGDYISYTPSKTNYAISSDLTNYSEQKINPSELNLWRVIKKNEDGTIEIVSEYVSSTNVYIKGKIGYEKVVGSLNTIAHQYETDGITTASRHMGYNGQTATVSVSETRQPWSDSTSSSNSLNGSARERNGGGDYGYITDFNLVNNALGTVISKIVGTDTNTSYWLASRNYIYQSTGNNTLYAIRYVNGSGILTEYNMYQLSGGIYENGKQYAIRPIVILKSGLTVTEGEKQNNKNAWIVNE